MQELTFTRIINAVGPEFAKGLDTAGLRKHFAVADLFVAGELKLAYWEVDRTALGGAIPTDAPLALSGCSFLATKHFCARRELGVLNLGGSGKISVDGETFELESLDALYVGRGAVEVIFESDDASNPAAYYLLSYPAHAEHPSMLVKSSSIEPLELGTKADCNERSLYKMICPGVVDSCQLVMGFTVLKTGSIWNTMPCHTHARRSEVYLYFNMPPERAVMHFMGQPSETRHLVLRNREAALSPNWSIHSGAGIGNYSFVWGMGGENQDFTDMDHLKVSELL